ncbi:MAG: TolC family outer membrane protein [Sphingomonas sp.]|uniref:TolC family outer membrane protein n=1 Tax=Sphingomonas sp. TaxID=28214 RepID=UPI001ACBD47B|nr:TolC family outer membrane protein [Sphingomonas sp.]MBN8807279.1 TolC family outer membrane protein [Sphingomonas sp.]
MRVSVLLGCVGLAALAAVPATADTLREALLAAYKNNPSLAAARAGVRATDENVAIAEAAGRPGVSVNGNYTENALNSANTFLSPQRQAQGNAQLVVPLYQGGRVANSIRGAETRVEASRAQLRGTESDLFVGVVGAYMDVIRDEAIVGLNQENVKVLEVNLQATRDRFQVGDLTRTDVAQSEARLSVARGQLETAQARLISSKESYIRLVGTPPGKLEDPPALPNLPDSADAAVDVALKSNPNLLAAQRSSDASRFDVSAARASRLPQVSGVVGGNYFNYLGSYGAGTSPKPGQTGSAATVGLQFTLPIYQGGLPAAQERQAQERRAQALETVTDTERAVIAQTRSAYAIWKSSLEVIASSQRAVEANKLSLEGVRAENSVGNRTILDILNAEQELLNSQVTLVTAQRDAYVAGFALLSAMGEAEARDLGLDGGVLYDPLSNYKRTKRSWSDFGGKSTYVPTGTSTRGTPAQDASQQRPLDPSLNAPVDTAPDAPPSGTRK